MSVHEKKERINIKEMCTRVKGTRKFTSQIKRTMEQSILSCKHIKRGIHTGLSEDFHVIIVTHGLLEMRDFLSP